jgi:hypothetical protein
MITNKHGLPSAFVEAVKRDPYTGGGDISTTALIDAPQRRALLHRHADSIQEDVSGMVWALMGQAVHHILERSEVDGVVVEERLYADAGGWKVSGQFDRYNPKTRALQDYKVTTVYKLQGDKKDWTRQLNVLRWLCHKNDIEVDRLQICTILRDWSHSRSLRDGSYPKTNVVMVDIEMWPLEQTEAYVMGRVEMHQAARDGEPIPCTDEERWYSGDEYAVRNPNHKRALKVCDNLADAEAFKTDSTVIEHRPGEYRRCMHFCEAAPFCSQWNDESR